MGWRFVVVHSVVSNSLQPHEPQHTRPPCLSPTSGAYPNSCPLSWWCHPTISSCRPLFLLPSLFPSIRVFSNESVLRIRWPEYWSFSFSISPCDEWSGLISLGWTGLISLQSKGCSRPFSNTIISPFSQVQFQRIISLSLNFLYSPTLTSIHNYC